MRPVSLALVHFPTVGREGQILTTTVTNLDVHDLARSARTYDLEDVFIVHPVEAQRTLVERIKQHWTEGSGGKRIPDRPAALDLIRTVSSLDEARAQLSARHGAQAQLWTTAAQARGSSVVSYADARGALAQPGPPVLLIFGTGWGLAPSVLDAADVRLEPIVGRGAWNHLSVRAACAISLDRLLG